MRGKLPLELTSTAKGVKRIAPTYESTILAEKGKLSLGSYAFAWGNKRGYRNLVWNLFK